MAAESLPIVGVNRTAARAIWRSGWLITALVVAYVLAFIDRQILSLLVQPLKHDLQLSDTQVGLLQGFAFAVCLAIAGLPIGRLLDRHRRLRLAAIGILLWSIMTGACGFATSFGTLVVFRIGVGIGEAVLTPAAHSLISDSVPQRALGLALGIFGLGSYLGAGISLMGGGVLLDTLSHADPSHLPHLAQLRPWQAIFVLASVCGVPVAAWLWLMREPARHSTNIKPRLDSQETRRFLKEHGRTLAGLNLTAAFVAMAVYSCTAWIPTFYMRSHGLTAADAGVRYGSIVILCGVCGVIAGGALSDYIVDRGVKAGRLWVMIVATACAVPFSVGATLVASSSASTVMVAALSFLTTIALGVLPSAQQSIAHSRVRGITAAMGIVMVNLLGMGVGPVAIALYTDRVLCNERLIGQSLATLLPTMLCMATVLGVIALPGYRSSLRKSG
jgi:MFS family permease